jgi:hypothetical protein
MFRAPCGFENGSLSREGIVSAKEPRSATMITPIEASDFVVASTAAVDWHIASQVKNESFRAEAGRCFSLACPEGLNYLPPLLIPVVQQRFPVRPKTG